MTVIESQVMNMIYMYSICVFILYLTKPACFFDKECKLRQFGVGYNSNQQKKTLFHMNIALLMLVFVIYLVFM